VNASANPSHVCLFSGTMVPAYSYPLPGSVYWQKLTDAAQRTSLVAIVNPSSGPGASVDANYSAAIGGLRTAGGFAIGYVFTSYGSRALSSVLADVDSFAAFYPLDGFFIDEMSTDSSATVLDYYSAIYSHVKSLNPEWPVVGNPGTVTDEAYLTRPATDLLVTFEGDPDAYAGYVSPPWVDHYSPDRFVHLVYGVVTADSMHSTLMTAFERRAGWVFVTDDVLPNP